MKKKVLIIIIFLLMIIILFSKKQNKIVKWINSEYGVQAVIISSQDIKDGVNYQLKDKEKGFEFNCTRKKENFDLDGSTFFHYKVNQSNYYEKLTEHIYNKMHQIEEKYNVKFFACYSNGLINQVLLPVTDESQIDFEQTSKAVNELMKIYNLKKNTTEEIFIYIGENQYTDFYYPYSIAGKETELHDSEDEFYQKNEISREMDKKIIEYVNQKYNVNCYKSNVSVTPYGVEPKQVIYIICEDEKKFKKEFRIDIGKYNEDCKNDNFKDMSYYILDEITYTVY